MNLKPIPKKSSRHRVHTPMVMQLEALECGAACLAMVLAYYGKWLPLEQVRRDCGVSRDGSNAMNIARAAQNYGMEVHAYRFEPEALRSRATFPCIVHWNFNHFVVINGFRGDTVYINDPARGVYHLSMEEFDKAFTGICLMFEPCSDFKPGGSRDSIIRYVVKRLKGAGVAVAFMIFASVISSLLLLTQPAFSRVFLDYVLVGNNPDWMYPFLGVMIASALLYFLVQSVHAVYALRIQGRLAVSGSASFFWRVLHLPMEFFSQRMAGDIQSRQESHGQISVDMVQTIAPVLLNLAMVVLYLVVMIRYSILLTLVGIGSMLINQAVSAMVSRRRVNITRVQMRDQGRLDGMTVSGIEIIESIKASGAENGFFTKWAGYQGSALKQKEDYIVLNHYLGMVPQLINSLSSLVVIFLGVLLAMRGQFSPGMILAFQGFLNSFITPTASLIEAGQTFQEMRTRMERVEDVMKYPCDTVEDVPGEQGSAVEEDCNKLSGRLELKNVTFGYSPLAEPLLEDFQLSLEPGSSVAVVGASGCGKSTLTKLISGLYHPWSGQILFDGKPIEEIPRNIFTGSVAVVEQNPTIFEDTVGNNIRMWDSSIENFEVILAARDAMLHEDILQRPGGYDYTVSEGGRDLSGGQCQRMEIARVLTQDPTIIVLDEATSALDADTEHQVVSSIRQRGVTCIVVAHRLSTVRDCDQIIVLDRGRIVEQGTHEQLFAAGGLYTCLVSND